MNTSLRVASIKDLDLIYGWANDPKTRKNSINQEKIPYDVHVEWYQKALLNSNYFFYIFEINEIPSGILKLHKENDCFVISFGIDISIRGKGLGEIVLSQGLDFHEKINGKNKYIGYVNKSNTASIKTFKKCQFHIHKEQKINGIDYLIFTK